MKVYSTPTVKSYSNYKTQNNQIGNYSYAVIKNDSEVDSFERVNKNSAHTAFKATFWKHIKYATLSGAATGSAIGANVGGVIDLGTAGQTLGIPTITGKIGGGILGGLGGAVTGTATYFISKDIEKRREEAEKTAIKLAKLKDEIEKENRMLKQRQAQAEAMNQEALRKKQALLDEQKKQIEILEKYTIKTINETSGIGMGRIAGYSEDKAGLNESFISPYKKSFYMDLAETGEAIPNGVLLYGNSGNGKTTLAEGIIQELQNTTNTQFYNLSDLRRDKLEEKLEEIKVKAEQDLVNENKRTIIFMDEFERFAPNMNIIKKKFIGKDAENPSNGYIKNFMNNCSDYGITIIATTNYPRDIEKPFIDNNKRFSVRTAIEAPNADDIKEILKYYLEGLTDETVDLQEITDILAGKIDGENAMFSGSKIEDIATKAKNAAKKERRLVSQDDLLKIANKIKPNIDSDDIAQFKDDFEFIANITYEEYLEEKQRIREEE